MPEQVYKFHCTTKPAAGQKRIFYGRYSDPDLASLLNHGVNTKPSILVGVDILLAISIVHYQSTP